MRIFSSPIRAGNDAAALTSRAEAAYLGLALGDALGATVEFMIPAEIRAEFGIHREIIGGGWLRLKPGQVTDDTTMAWALGNAIIQEHGAVVPLSCARAFDAWMRGKPVDIGNTVRRNLILFRSNGATAAPPSPADAGNGAAMRLLPVALATIACTEEQVRAAVRTQAHVTHHNDVSDAACECLALTVQDALRGAGLGEIHHRRIEPLIARHPEFRYRGRRRDNPSGWIVETMQAVLQALFDNTNFETTLVDVVNRGGDSDTTGAIAGMVAGALYGLDALPRRWLKVLSADTRNTCIDQAHALISLGLQCNEVRAQPALTT
jgi:ADP-ribosyl-[dinitrogen reductase] hydrolase